MEIFADTFFWIALLNTGDQYHQKVSSVVIDKRIVTSVAVLLEVLDAFSYNSQLRELAVDFWELCKESEHAVLVSLEHNLLERSIDLYRNRKDKHWTFTDCISFEIMRERNIPDALTADRHFVQAGFHAVFADF